MDPKGNTGEPIAKTMNTANVTAALRHTRPLFLHQQRRQRKGDRTRATAPAAKRGSGAEPGCRPAEDTAGA